jgi:hypothetical protein
MRSFFRSLRRWPGIVVATALAAAGSIVFATLPAAHASIPQHTAWKSSARFGIWHNHGFNVYNNEWNTSEAGPQTIWANSFQHWGVESRQPGTTSVKTYPSVQRNYRSRAYTSLKSLTSTYTESMPSAPGFIAEAAYDLWLNNFNIEVMMWVDNHRQVPAGHVIGTVNIYGKRFRVWQSGHDMFSFALVNKRQRSGKVHLLSALRWLVNHGRLSRSVTLRQVDFGWEIASTHGAPMDFIVTRYSLKTRFK